MPASDARPTADAVPAAVAAVLATLRGAGFRAFLVGGCVRDLLRDLPVGDFDVTTDASPDRVLALFPRAVPTGIRHGTVMIPTADGPVDVTRFRAGERLEDDLAHRDFTINAIAWDPLSDAYEDPFDGRGDLARRVLRAVDTATFGDDSLRVLRAVQFAARFDLTLDETTAALCRALPLDDLPAERVWGEMEKLLLQAARPSTGLALALDLGVVARLWPECLALVGCPQEPDWHPEGDVWTHTLQVVDEARARIDNLSRPQRVAVMLGAIAHDFGKPATTATVDGRIRSLGHEEAGVEPAGRFLDRLNVHTMEGYDVRRQVLGLVAHHLKPGAWHKAASGVGDGAFRRLALKVDLDLLARLAEADCVGRRPGTFDCSAMGWFLDRARMLGVQHRAPARLLLGRHLLALDVPPGPGMGRILDAVYERQLDGEVTTVDEALAAARALIAAAPG